MDRSELGTKQTRWGALLFASFFGLVALSSAIGIDLQSGLRDNTAQAIDLFGSKQETVENDDEPKPFWTDGSGLPKITPRGVPAGFADLAERVSPAIVNIQTRREDREGGRQFEEFFGHPFLGERGRRSFRRESLGSGFVISGEGYIVTNNHVIENADSIAVAFKDGSELEAKVIGRDPKTDIALIQIGRAHV